MGSFAGKAAIVTGGSRGIGRSIALKLAAEGADVAVFAGDRRGIIYVQGKRVANVPEAEILDRLLDECRLLQDRVRSGDAMLGDKKVDIIPPDPIGELGSGIDRIAAGEVEQITVGRT